MAINKRGWMRILEATISVMIISGIMIVLYSNQESNKSDPGDYLNRWGQEVLMDISSSSELRLLVLNKNKAGIFDYVDGEIPNNYGFNVSICELGSDTDFCVMEPSALMITKDKEVYTNEIIVSSELGHEGFTPMKVKLYLWE